jgi:hypothetical protein
MGKTIKSLHNKAWRLMSEFVRRRDQGRCITCGKIKYWKKQDAGHCFHGKGDFNEMNINCQCRACNSYKSKGNEYSYILIKKHGIEKFDKMYYEIHVEPKRYAGDYEQIIDDLKEKIKELEGRGL